ncbi:peptidylprolyl isomerase [Chitinasiproducens palmae]|nr:peptidylprolyl isomerase [Chitinasiproducens palmae]
MSTRFRAPLAALVLLGALQGPAAHAQALSDTRGQPVDRIVAIVNNGVITQRQLDQRVEMIRRRLGQGAQLPPDDQLRSQVLNQMVLDDLQLQRAKEGGITVDDGEVDRTVERLAQANGMTVTQFRNRLAAEHVDWDSFREDARNELLLTRLRQREVDSRITVSDAEVASYLASQRGSGPAASEVNVQRIVFKVDPNAPADQQQAAQQRAEAALKEVQGGADFARLAKRESQAEEAAKGGEMGFQAADTLSDEYRQAVANLAPGQVAPNVVHTSQGYEVVRLAGRRAQSGANQSVTQTHASHILIRIGNGTSEPAARNKLLDIKRQVEAGGDFGAFARANSQDGSAATGGDLGWINPGQTVPEFERAMNRLPIGQVSDPIRTEYGYHLILVSGRRQTQESAQQQQEAARQTIGARKADQAFDDWLRQLRDSAYIQYKLDDDN